MPKICTSIPDLLTALAPWREAGESIAFVPTMGALHSGHHALMDVAHELADRVVVSIFVNPRQFGANEDFGRYPITPEADIKLMHEAGVDLAWVPQVEDMYPEGYATSIHVAGLSGALCGLHRPGHFDGVATVVAKLLNVLLPHVAVFGEKDYQQLCIVRRLVADLAIPVEIIGMETIREADGLALSSRNRYLSVDDRKKAPALHATLQAVRAKMKTGMPVQQALAEGKAMLMAAGFTAIDYLEYCEEDTLQPLAEFGTLSRLLAAVWLVNTRLIDNIAIEEDDVA